MFGFFGLIGVLIVVALVFGKRVRKQWEFEAEFRDDKGREFGEFEIEMSRIEKEEPDYTLKVSFRMRHASLQQHQTIQVFLDDEAVLEGMVKKAGEIYLDNKHLRNRVESVQAGQRCRVVSGGLDLFIAEILPD